MSGDSSGLLHESRTEPLLCGRSTDTKVVTLLQDVVVSGWQVARRVQVAAYECMILWLWLGG